MAHRSWCAEHPGTLSNERLEFLGDAVLGWVIADLAYRRFTDLPEGALTGVRKGVVNALALAEVAEELELGKFLLLGRGEDAAGGREKPSILSDALEAVIGAVYVDGGPEQAYALVERLIGPRLAETAAHLDHLDHKSRLQEQVATEGGPQPEYVTRAEGPDHAKRFYADVVVNGTVIGQGTGRSKKAAEQSAAAAAVARLDAAAANGGTVSWEALGELLQQAAAAESVDEPDATSGDPADVAGS
jgi:ribonuclease-3